MITREGSTSKDLFFGRLIRTLEIFHSLEYFSLADTTLMIPFEVIEHTGFGRHVILLRT